MRDCRICRTVFTAFLPAPEEGHDYRDYYDADNLEPPAFVRRRLDELVSAFEDDRRLNRWLDVGFGAGELMNAAAAHGWQVVGTEVSPRPLEVLSEAGYEVHLGELGDSGLSEEDFDVVSLIEVLEHVRDPGGLLDAASERLRPGGRLWVTTPHSRGISARLLRTRWSVMSPPEHLQLFSVAGLRLALGRAGMVDCAIRIHAVNPYELLCAMRTRSGGGDFDRVETSYRLNESLSEGRGGRLAKAVVNAVLNALRLGDSIKVIARRARTSRRSARSDPRQVRP
jgi:SAM-dependent methyltransferase